MIRSHVAVHRAREPNPYRISAARVEKTWYLRFPERTRPDAEAFFVWGGFGYIVGKTRTNDSVGIYRYPLSASGSSIPLEKVTDVRVAAPVTAADISSNGERLALLTEEGAYALFINGDVSQAGSAPRTFTRFVNELMEGACFVGNGLLVSAEARQIYLFTAPAFRVD
ncbi:MAG: hypothetical protein L0Y58_04870 [Verrucomicrobia subdivision 3 bacterium]|nr:hypothetical protein [Limisphaerales bacterium]